MRLAPRARAYPARVGETVDVRAATRADAVAIREIYAPVVTGSATSFEVSPPDADEIVRRMLCTPRLPWLVATRGEPVVGYAYASVHRARHAYRWSVECSVFLREAERGRGTGRRLYQRLFAELEDLGYVSVFAGVVLPNPASVGLHEAMGFEPIGVFDRVGFKHGAWRDVGWWQLSLARSSGRPADPRPWDP